MPGVAYSILSSLTIVDGILMYIYLSTSMCVRRGAISVTMYNFGSPRVGNRKFADVYNEVTMFIVVVSKFSTMMRICLYVSQTVLQVSSLSSMQLHFFLEAFPKEFLLLVNL